MVKNLEIIALGVAAVGVYLALRHYLESAVESSALQDYTDTQYTPAWNTKSEGTLYV